MAVNSIDLKYAAAGDLAKVRSLIESGADPNSADESGSGTLLGIRTSKFPILLGENEELVNPGTHGKAFALYLQAQLALLGYSTPFVCCEDWGWWVEILLPEKVVGLSCYRHHEKNEICDFVCTASPESDRVWSWRRFRTIDIGNQVDRIVADLIDVFENDSEIEFIGRTDEFPF